MYFQLARLFNCYECEKNSFIWFFGLSHSLPTPRGKKGEKNRAEVKTLLHDNPQLADELEGKIREKIKELQAG